MQICTNTRQSSRTEADAVVPDRARSGPCISPVCTLKQGFPLSSNAHPIICRTYYPELENVGLYYTGTANNG
jgi:hypothetical protein